MLQDWQKQILEMTETEPVSSLFKVKNTTKMNQPNQNNGLNPTAQELQNKLDSIFDYVSGGFLTMFEYSDWKVAKGQKLAMDDLLKKFFYIQKAESEAKKTALRIAEQFEINTEVINQLKKINK